MVVTGKFHVSLVFVVLCSAVAGGCAHTTRVGSRDSSAVPSAAALGLPEVTAELPAAEPDAPVEPATPDPLESRAAPVDLLGRLRAGFQLPSDTSHADIERQLEWFVGNPGFLQRSFARGQLYMYYIVSQLEMRGMPLELALLPIVESAFEPYAVSKTRAVGLWQFEPDTAARFGLRRNWWYDGRRDIVESTRAALDYLKILHEEFHGDWLVAIAAYDCGEGTVRRAIEFNQARGRDLDFWSLALPRETRAYVPQLLALRRLVADPEGVGLSLRPIANEPYFMSVTTYGQIDLTVAATLADIPAAELYALNPAFHRWATDPAGPHFLLLPVAAADAFARNLTRLDATERLEPVYYTVRRGDSFASIAHRFNTKVSVVRELNNLAAGRLTVGAEIELPPEKHALPVNVLLAATRADAVSSATRSRHRASNRVRRRQRPRSL